MTSKELYEFNRAYDKVMGGSNYWVSVIVWAIVSLVFLPIPTL